MRRVAAVSALLALACAVAVVLTSDGGFDALLANGSDAVTKANHQLAAIERTPALARNAAESMLKKSKNKKHPWMDNEAFRGIYPSHHFGPPGCDHDFRDLCSDRYYQHGVKDWYDQTDWLDGNERLEEAHNFDQEQEMAFQEATKELHNKVMLERQDWNAEMREQHEVKQDKYFAYQLRLEAEKNKTAEILTQWKEKRDAEVAKIDADYLEHLGNVTLGVDYKMWYDQALAMDKERRAKFHKMINDMKSAGATEKDINTAVLAFKRQESLFQTQLKGHSSAFSDEHERIHMLKAKAQRELAVFKKQQKEEEASESIAENKYEIQQAKERAEAKEAAARILQEREHVQKTMKETHSYEKDLIKMKDAEATRQNDLEEKIREAKKEEKLHAEEMQAKASAEVAADANVHDGEKPAEKVEATKPAQKQAIKPAEKEAVKPAEKEAVKPAEKAAVKPAEKEAMKPAEKRAATQQLAVRKEHVKEAATEAAHEAAFLKALSQQADAEFQSLSTTPKSH